jgi:hypothetical protein
MYFKEEFFWSFLEKLEIIKPDSKLLESGFRPFTQLLIDSTIAYFISTIFFVWVKDFPSSDCATNRII